MQVLHLPQWVMELTAFLHVQLRLEPLKEGGRLSPEGSRVKIFGNLSCSFGSGPLLTCRSHGPSLGSPGSSGGIGICRSVGVTRLLYSDCRAPDSHGLSWAWYVRAPRSNCPRAQRQPRTMSGAAQDLPGGLQGKPALLASTHGSLGSAAQSGRV